MEMLKMEPDGPDHILDFNMTPHLFRGLYTVTYLARLLYIHMAECRHDLQSSGIEILRRLVMHCAGVAPLSAAITHRYLWRNPEIMVPLQSHSKLTCPLGFPDGLSYQFTYDPAYGLIKRITYPTGAWVEYTWGVNPNSEMMGWQTPGQGTSNVESSSRNKEDLMAHPLVCIPIPIATSDMIFLLLQSASLATMVRIPHSNRISCGRRLAAQQHDGLQSRPR